MNGAASESFVKVRARARGSAGAARGLPHVRPRGPFVQQRASRTGFSSFLKTAAGVRGKRKVAAIKD